jgi:AcrR family transcriptional regulator
VAISDRWKKKAQEDSMKSTRKDLHGTRRNLLDAASNVFAEKGYRSTTVAEICKRAGANIAAVNYHFRNKTNLYCESWKHCFAQSINSHPPDGGVSVDAPPEERLRGLVTALLQRISDRKNREFSIVQKELANPTGLLHQVMKRELKPLRDRMEAVVRDLLGPHVSQEQVIFCGISIVSQCISPMVALVCLKGKSAPSGIEDMTSFANHVVHFSLAGIRGVRSVAETEKSTGPGRA